MTRIYYGDGSTFDGPPELAPPLDVQAINQLDEHGERETFRGDGYYWFDSGRWYCGDLFGLFDFLMRSGLVKFGRYIPRSQYDAICERARTDPDFATSGAREYASCHRDE